MYSLSETVERKFESSIDVDGWEILSDDGWQPITHIHKTIKYVKWILTTETGKYLECADTHILFDENYNEIFAKDCLPHETRIITDSGFELVTSVIETDESENMYDVTVDSDTHRFFSNGILSHNTTCAGGYLLWYAMFHPDSTILVAANNFKAATEIMDRIKFAYEELPPQIKAGISVYNVQTIKFDNGSRIISRATTADAARGLSISLLLADEFAFVRPTIADSFFTAISPTLATGGKCIIISTPNSDEDKFAEIWFGAIKTTDEYGNEIPGGVGCNGFKGFTCKWDDVPGRDDEWAEKEKNKIGHDKFEREYNCKFLSADDTLINPAKLLQLQGIEPIHKTHGQVRWYQPLCHTKTYLVSLDPSAGVGKDSAAIEVYSLPDLCQVAEWTHNKTDIPNQVKLMQNIIKYIYNEIKRMPDNRGDPEIFYTIENNTWGEAALVTIQEIGEDRFNGIFLHEPKKSGGGRFRKGLNTNGRSKNLACSKLKSLIEGNRLIVHSKQLVRQLKFFVGKGESFAAKIGEHDDCVMATILCIRMMQIVSGWDEKFEDAMKNTFDGDDDDFEPPMPMIFG